MAQKKDFDGYRVALGDDVLGFLNLDSEIEFDDVKIIFTLDKKDYECSVELIQKRVGASILRRKKKSTATSV